MSVSSNCIARFIHFALKIGNRKFYHIGGISNERDGMIGVQFMRVKYLS